jgi:hypothetical protein
MAAAISGVCSGVAAAPSMRGRRLVASDGSVLPMGSPQMQVLVYSLSDPMSDTAARDLVKSARWGREDDTAGQGVDELRWKMSQIHVAQAEYYLDSSVDEELDAPHWHQKWRARLRRFRPQDLEPPNFAYPPAVTSWFLDVCTRRWSTTAGVCQEIEGLLQAVRPVVIH